MVNRYIDITPYRPYANPMQIELTPEQDSFVKDAIAKGRYQSASEAVHRALNQWVERERTRLELIAAIEDGEQSLQEDGGIVLETEEEIHNYFNGIAERGRVRLSATQKTDLCA